MHIAIWSMPFQFLLHRYLNMLSFCFAFIVIIDLSSWDWSSYLLIITELFILLAVELQMSDLFFFLFMYIGINSAD